MDLVITAAPRSADKETKRRVREEFLAEKATVLRNWNTAAIVLHVATALAQFSVLMVYLNSLYKSDITLTDTNGVTTTIGSIPVGALLVVTGFVTAIFHVLYQMNDILMPSLKRGFTSLRWVEYAISANLMTVAVALLSNVRNFWLIFALVAATATMMFTGYMMEHRHKRMHRFHYTEQSGQYAGYGFHARKEGDAVDWTAFGVGSALFVMIWVIIGYHFIDSAVLAAGGLPWFVWATFIGLFVMFAMFGAWQFLRFVHIPHDSHSFLALAKSNSNYELGYVLLSLLAKLYLSWILFGASLSMGLAV
jgi:hypothetical protein